MSEFKRNCNTCKYGFMSQCDELKNNKEYQALQGTEPFKVKENHICDNYDCMYIQYPLEISGIDYNTEIYQYKDSGIGKFASVRPCADNPDNKTYLGLFLGDLPLGIRVSHNSETSRLNVRYDANPAIFVFELNKIVYGACSWWHIIEKEDDLCSITDKDINNLWYVKALQSLNSKEASAPPALMAKKPRYGT